MKRALPCLTFAFTHLHFVSCPIPVLIQVCPLTHTLVVYLFLYIYTLLRLAPYRKNSLRVTLAEQGYSEEQETNVSKLLPVLNIHHQNINVQTEVTSVKDGETQDFCLPSDLSLKLSQNITHPHWAILCFCLRTCSISSGIISNRASKTE